MATDAEAGALRGVSRERRHLQKPEKADGSLRSLGKEPTLPTHVALLPHLEL